ncbi:MAG: phosphohistidine phosphatase SixA [Deltaproteobacteria bacterium]|nr:phosphohistidine phosphatase SixA [Deltaproteobacteria bacterium]MBF0526096.1 phosphohistidine phosphatase SixA [Deltaproteobacteria bacterium]
MDLYLIRHGQALSKEIDPEEGLSSAGRDQIRICARMLAKTGVTLDAILTSPKKRAHESASICAQETGVPQGQIISTELLKPMADAQEAVAYLDRFAGHPAVLVAGHLPSLARITAHLLADRAELGLFADNGTLAKIQVTTFGALGGRLQWYVTPELISRVMGQAQDDQI